MKCFTNSRKFLFGLSVSMVLAMAIGSFALGESQTQASPQEVEVQNAVGATAGAFTVNGGTQGTDYEFTGTTGTDGVLKIHPQSIGTNITISNSNTEATTDRIEVTSAATITLAGVNIDRSSETEATAPITITDNAAFDVNILLADGSTNILKGRAGSSYFDPGSPGIQKNGNGDSIGTLTIGVPNGSAGTGKLTATGGSVTAAIGGGKESSGSNITITGGDITANGGGSGPGIGGGMYGSGNNITITGGDITANGGSGGPGIGGGGRGNGSNIKITGGEVMAIGGLSGAGIGGGEDGNGSNITINGGVVTAYGGVNPTAGIGGGRNGSGSNNSISGDAVVLAASGSNSRPKPALEGFDSLLVQGIVFTGLVTAFDYSDFKPIAFSWDESGTVYGDSVTISQNVEFPANLTIEDGKEITLEAGKTLAISAGATLTNEGIFNIGDGGSITCQYDEATGTTGEVTTKTDFYREGSTDVYTTGYQTYQTSAGIQKYTNLPNPDQTNANGFVNWYYLDQASQKVSISEDINVLLNEHSFYENRVYTVTVAELDNGTITPNVTEAAKDDTVTLTVTPNEGYQLKEGSLIVTDADGNEVPVTEQDGKYIFTMPGADVTVNAAFELIPEPTVDPGVKTGDSFAGFAALAILGVATTGAALLRKRK